MQFQDEPADPADYLPPQPVASMSDLAQRIEAVRDRIIIELNGQDPNGPLGLLGFGQRLAIERVFAVGTQTDDPGLVIHVRLTDW